MVPVMCTSQIHYKIDKLFFTNIKVLEIITFEEQSLIQLFLSLDYE